MTARAAVLTWDWKEQPDLNHLAALLLDLSGGTVHLHEVDTGSDQFAIVLATAPLSDEQVDAVWVDTTSRQVVEVPDVR